ncbi:rod shape-determining protein RodA [Myxococcota bacterium]|nr:rod shape-determining protein RodA [Myxococcota bacterium]MBU1381514.1 rod shape-determining protein RodA [Myxococcota bacterium]MBU1497521.1 rod shape-determining protein RodA [Myxococcota bacterium]
MFEPEGRFFLRIDWTLLLLVGSIIGLGLMNLHSASANVNTPMFTQQVYWIFLGGSAFFITATIDYRVYNRIAYFIYIMGILALALVLIIGKVTHGSRRWLNIGPIGIQPSELMKIAVILAMAHHIDASPPKTEEGRTMAELMPPAFLVFIPFLLILIQPDLGTGLIILLVFFSIMFLLKLRIRSLLTLISSAAILMPLIWTFVLQGYQKKRILVFLDPSSDPTGEGWHIRQSIFAIGSGKFFGKGYMRGTQSQFHFLPAQWSDFPFSVWSEEWGFLGSLVILGLYLVLIMWAIRLATITRDRFASVICIGVGAMFFWHTIINLGMIMGLLPIVGVTLPLFSHGGSSMLTFMIGAGLLMSVSARRQY